MEQFQWSGKSDWNDHPPEKWKVRNSALWEETPLSISSDDPQFSVVVQSLSLVWLLRPHGLRRARLPCPSLSLGICSNSCPPSQCCYLTISSSTVPFFCLQSFPASGSFPVSWLIESDGQNTGSSASASVFLMNIQGWLLLVLTGLISFQSKVLSSLLQHHNLKASILWHSAFSG